MSFFKRLSRGSRSNSYVEEYIPDSPTREKHTFHDSPRNSTSQHNTISHNQPTPPHSASGPDMYAHQQTRSQAPSDPYSRQAGSGPQMNGHRATNSTSMMDGPVGGVGGGGLPLRGGGGSGDLPSAKLASAPDLLTRAFNEAMRPYQDKVEQLEQQLADLQWQVDELEKQRAEVHSWIDKRGLRPDVPPSVAKILDAQPDAASTLNAQLDRKITIVNFDLHRLQDDLNDSISSAHFAAAMSKFLPDISRLSSLPTGARHAFDLILKLGGNLNAHGGIDSSDAADLSARRDFYAQLDKAMVEVVRRRFQEGEEWPVGREIKRIEKTAAYLRNFGVEPYFPATLEAMRREVDYRAAGPPGGQGGNVPPQAHSPPRY